MCLEAIKQARIKKIYYLVERNKKIKEKEPQIIKIKNVENSSNILKEFFKNKRK